MKNKLQKKIQPKRIGAVLMAGTMLAGSFGMSASAGAPQVKVDESVYVNMDYYGAVEDISVVKGCFLNGNTVIEDYGEYDEIINMSNRVEPTVSDGKVVWDLSSEEENQFYYECKSQSLQQELPWSFDVTYKLNGVEKRGEELAGANGEVSIEIDAIPNTKASEYYRNNMILICGTAVDMNDNLSIEAEGAQMQSFGTMKGVIFMALPGEEGEFRIDIGSENFECMGIFFMMVPATLSSLEMVNDIRDVRDTAEDSLDAMSDAADAILDDIIAMKDNMQTTKQGLEAAQSAKNTYDANRDSIKADADAAIDSISNISAYLEVLNNEIEVDQDNLLEVTERLDAINKTINGMRDYYDDMDERMEGIEDGIHGLRKVTEGTITDQGLTDLQYLLAGPAVVAALPNGSTISLRDVLEIEGASSDAQTVEHVANANGYGHTEGDVGLAVLLKNFQDELNKVGEDEILDGLVDAEGLIDRVQDILDKIDSVLAQTNSLSNFVTGPATDDTLYLCQQLEELVDEVNVSMLTVQSSMKTMRYTLDAMEPSMDVAIDSTLNGLIGIMGNGISMTDSVDLVRNAKDTMKNAIDDELDKLEDDSNVLNLDVTQEFPSFTSDKNPSPETIQIIMRTAEISIDDNVDNVTDIEQEPEDIGVWGRLMAIFKQIWESITGIFG